jgi:SagB-type dehydrogenase family enzyme
MRRRGCLARRVLILVAVIAATVATGLFLISFLPRPRVKVQEAFGIVELPAPKIAGTMSVEEAIAQRRSIRNYSSEPLSLEDISQLVWAAQGITEPQTGKRAAPSAGGTYPLEVYVVVGTNGVTGLAEGVYRYDPFEHRVKNILKGDIRSSLAEAALGQSWVREAPVNIIIAAVYERTTGRYGDRGIRYVHMEVGHAGQNLYLQAVARGLGMVVVGAFDDEEVQQLLQLSADQKPLYIIPIGHPSG